MAAAKRAVAKGRAASVSAYIAEALARRSADDELLGMLAGMKAEQAPGLR